MTAFSNIPPHAVLPLGAYDLDELRKSATRADQRLLHADLSAAGSKAEVLDALARAFALPRHFGRNLDALYDCITDLKPVQEAEQGLQRLQDALDVDSHGLEPRLLGAGSLLASPAWRRRAGARDDLGRFASRHRRLWQPA